MTQYFAIWLYARIKEKTGHRLLWLRAIVVTLSAQAIDSVLFFSMAFTGTLPSEAVFEILLVGYVIKVLIGTVSIPFMYLSFKLKKI